MRFSFGNVELQAERDDVLESGPGCQLNIEILSRLVTPGAECSLTLGQNDESCAMLCDRLNEVERAIAVPSGKNSAEAGIAG
jgi:hypothetical protein